MIGHDRRLEVRATTTVAAFLQQCRIRPLATALFTRDGAYTYSDVLSLANRYASALALSGVRRGAVVPILLPPSSDLIAAMIGTNLVNAAYTVLDERWPEQRHAHILGAIGASVGISRGPITSSTAIHVVSPSDVRLAEASEVSPTAIASDAFCVFFTSGTTGQPKGVVCTHAGIMRLFSQPQFATFNESTIIPQLAPPQWDASALEIWGALTNGGTLVVTDEPLITPRVLKGFVSGHAVNTLWLTSSLFNLVVDEDVTAFSGLTTVLTGGERLSQRHVKTFLQAHPGIALINGYGPVETTVFATTHRISLADCSDPAGIPIGSPVPGTEIRIMNEERRCESGQVGEICVLGDGVAQGYLNDQVATDARFGIIVDAGTRTKMYRTGDLGFFGTDGLLRYCGRGDRQVKIRGHRIEPAEIEATLSRVQGVKRVVVLPKHNASGSVLGLHAFFSSDDADKTRASMIACSEEALAHFQRPSAFHPVETFPLRKNGKLDTDALWIIAADQTATIRHVVAARDDLDPLTADVLHEFSSILQAESGFVDMDTDFTAMGGTSLEAIRLCSRLEARLGTPIPVSRFFECPTVSGVVKIVQSRAGHRRPESGDTAVEMSAMQRSLFVKHIVENRDDVASHCFLLWRTRAVDSHILRKALEAVHLRHESLRSRYILKDGRYLLETMGVTPDIRTIECRQTQAVSRVSGLLREPFALEEGRCWRAVIAECGEDVFLGVAFHHIVFDGWSESVFSRDLSIAYGGIAEDSTPIFLTKAPTIREIERYQRRIERDADLDTQRAYWRTELAGLSDLIELPAHARRDRLISRRKMTDPEIAGGLRRLAHHHGTSLFTVLVSAYARALSQLFRNVDFGIGVPIMQRSSPAVEGAICCLVNTICLRVRPNPADDIGEAIGKAIAVIRQALANHDVPMTEVIRMLNGPRKKKTNGFQTIFALQDNAAPILRLKNMHAEFIALDHLAVPAPILAEVWPASDGGLELRMSIEADVVDEERCEALFGAFVSELTTWARAAKIA